MNAYVTPYKISSGFQKRSINWLLRHIKSPKNQDESVIESIEFYWSISTPPTIVVVIHLQEWYRNEQNRLDRRGTYTVRIASCSTIEVIKFFRRPKFFNQKVHPIKWFGHKIDYTFYTKPTNELLDLSTNPISFY